jgi:hypothetical protein
MIGVFIMAEKTVKVTDRVDMVTFVLVSSYGDILNDTQPCNGIFSPSIDDRKIAYSYNGYTVKKTVKLYTVKKAYAFPISEVKFPDNYADYLIDD